MTWPFNRKKKSTFAGLDFMQLIPEPSYQVEWDENRTRAKVLVPRYSSWPFDVLLQPRLGPEKRYIRVPLESRGSFLWKHMDGKLSIADLLPRFLEAFPEDTENAPRRLSQFLFSMHQNKFITFKNISE